MRAYQQSMRAYQQSDAAMHMLQDVKGPANKQHTDKTERGNIHASMTTNICYICSMMTHIFVIILQYDKYMIYMTTNICYTRSMMKHVQQHEDMQKRERSRKQKS